MLQILCKCKLWLTLLSGSRRNGRNDNDVADEGIRNHQLIKTVVTCLVNQLAPCVTQLISLSRAEFNLRTSLARNTVLCDRNQFYFWLISSVRCPWRVTIPMRMLQEDTKAEFMQIYLLPLTATLKCLIHWPLSRQHYQGKKKKSCGWGAKMCILHPGFWLSVSNIAYWFAASCHTPDWAKLICSCSL